MNLQPHFALAYGAIHTAADRLARLADDNGQLRADATLAEVVAADRQAREGLAALNALRSRMAGNPEPQVGP